MRKKDLRESIDSYNKNRRVYRFKKDERITLLEDFLNQSGIKKLGDDADIPIKQFTQYLAIKLKDDEQKRKDFFSQEFLTGSSLSAEIINQFINAETTVEFAPRPAKTSAKPEKMAFMLDLDENIISTISTTPEEREVPLSKSAEIQLSRSSEGIIDNPAITPEISVKRITAFRRPEWKVFFERVVAINDRYCEVTGDKIPVINCLFLTSGKYAADEFKQNIFTKLFGKALADKIIPDPGTQLFNRDDQLRVVESVDKGKFLSALFPFIKEHLGLQFKNDLVLVDDSSRNINSAKAHGFSGIHHPSSTHTRPQGITFTEHGPAVFKQLHARLDVIEEIVKALEQSKRSAPK